MHIPNFSEIEQSAAELFQGSNEPFLRDEWTELYTKLGEVICPSHAVPKISDIPDVAPFQFSKPERVKGDWGQTWRPNFGLFDRLQNMGGASKISSQFLLPDLRPTTEVSL